MTGNQNQANLLKVNHISRDAVHVIQQELESLLKDKGKKGLGESVLPRAASKIRLTVPQGQRLLDCID